MATCSVRVLSFVLPALLLACNGSGSDDTDTAGTDSPSDTDKGTTETGVPPETGTDTGTGGTEGPEALCQVTAECFGGILDDPKTPCDLTVADGAGVVEYQGTAGFELRGRSSLYYPKPQYSIELRTHSELSLWPGSTWSYLDDGSNPGPTWTQAAYDDSSWSSGPAPLGWGLSYLQTWVDPTPVTIYLRRTFTIYSLPEVTTVEVGIKADDGSAVYINGVEVLRDNLPPGAGPDTLASGVSDRSEYLTVDLDPSLVVQGDNVIAVEVHQAAPGSADMRFDMYVEATGDDAPASLGGMGREDDWILNGQYVDRALFRNRLAYDLFQSFGGPERYATEMRFCELELNGEYQGIYTLGEKLERDDDRIDITPGTNPGDSFIIKLDDEAGFHDNAIGNGTWQLVYPDGDAAAEAAVSSWLTDLETAVGGPNPGDPTTGVFSYIDLDSAVDWILINEAMKNHDAYLLSIYLWRDDGGKAFFAPWDFDLSMGSYPYTDCSAEGWNLRFGNEMVEAFAADPTFHDALVARWAELRQTELTEDAVLARIAAYDQTLAPGLDANVAAWPVEDIAFAYDGIDNWLCPVASYDDEHANVLAFVSARLAWMDANISGF